MLCGVLKHRLDLYILLLFDYYENKKYKYKMENNMTKSNILIVSYNPDNQSNIVLYNEIAHILGAELKEIVSPIMSRESLEILCEGKTPRLFIHDGTTYKNDPILKRLKKLSPEQLLDYNIELYKERRDFPIKPCMIYNGKGITLSDTLGLIQTVGFDWVFGHDSLEFTPNIIRKIIERLEDK